MRKSRACGARLGQIGRGRLARSGAGRRTCRGLPRSGQRPKGGFLNTAGFRKIPIQPGREVDVWASFSDDRLEPSYAGLQTGHVAAAKSARRHIVDRGKFQLRAGQAFVPDAVAVDALRTGFSAAVAAWNGAIALRKSALAQCDAGRCKHLRGPCDADSGSRPAVAVDHGVAEDQACFRPRWPWWRNGMAAEKVRTL